MLAPKAFAGLVTSCNKNAYKANGVVFLKIDVTAALNYPGKPTGFDLSEEIGPAEIAGETFEFISPLNVAGTLMYTGEDFIVKGGISVSYKTECDRCTKELHNTLGFDFSEEFAKTEDEGHPDRYLFSQNEIDLMPMVMDNISLMMPMKHLCDVGCKGLCPICGGNLNEKDCGCLEEEKLKNSPFAKIKDLNLDDDGEV